MTHETSFSPPARALIVAGAVALVIGVIKLSAPILTPILLAAFIATVSIPALTWMRRHGVPKWGALAVIVILLLDVGSLFALMTTGAMEGFRDSLPGYQERFEILEEQFGKWAEGVGIAGSREAVPDLVDPDKATVLIGALLSGAGSLIGTGAIVLIIAIFMLIEAPALPGKLSAAFKLTAQGEARLKRVPAAINSYMRIKCLTSLAMALAAWLLLWLLGIDFAVLWGALAFVSNFVPVVGGVVMMVPPVLLALLGSGVQTSLLVLGGYLLLHVLIGEILEPRMMGKGLGMSALTVLIALLFWGWLLGPVGMFLAVPLTTVLILALEASPDTRPLALLLGSAVPESVAADSEADDREALVASDDTR